jgi:glycosyltransferase involved in cell wall biosynthesis
MSQKKILMLTSKFPSNVSTFITRDFQILVAAGYHVDIYPITPLNEDYWKFVPVDGMKLIEEGKVTVYNFSKKEILLNALKFWKYPKISFFKEAVQIAKESVKFGKSQLVKSLYAILWTLSLRNKQGDESYDRVVSYWANYSATSAYLFSKYSNSNPPLVMYAHAGVDLYRDQIYLLEKLQYAHKIITVCQFNVDFMQELYPDAFDSFKDKISIYHLPLPMKELPDVQKVPNQIIAVSTLNIRKGINYLVDACGLLKKDGMSFSLLIIGGGEEEQNLKNQVKELGLEEITTFTGQIPYEEVETNMAQSVVLAHCSPELGDAVPTVIKESLMVGTPVVGSDIVGIPELLDYGKCGLLFEPKNAQDLHDKLKIILEDEALQKEMSVKGRAFAEKMFDIKINSKQLVSIMEE